MDSNDDTYRIRTTKASSAAANSDTAAKKDDAMEWITSRTGGAYIPPAKLRLLQKRITDKASNEFQRLSWEALKKSINGLINKVNVSNIAIIVRELFKENLIRGRGLLCRSVIQAQSASPTFTHVYAALIAILNTKFPKIGELVLKRLIIQFRKSYRRNDKQVCLVTTRFIAHLVNQEVSHEIVALELLTLLLENATNDSVEVAVAFLKECGRKLSQVSHRGIIAIFERLRNILHEGLLDKRVQYMIEVMFAIRKDDFKDHLAIIPELDLIEESEQFTHLMTLEEPVDSEDKINVYCFDQNFLENEDKYKAIKKEILDDESTDDEEHGSQSENESSDENDDEEDGDEEGADSTTIIDNTETNLTALRRTIYLTIQSSLDFEECAHKLLKLELKPGQIVELCHMIVDCCAQQRTYMKFYGLLAQRFCELNAEYAQPFSDIFKSCYDTIHRFETNKLRNVSQLFAHLLVSDAIPWTVLAHIKLNEEDTTSSSRVFIKILFQELAAYMSLSKLNERIKDTTMQEAFDGLFPRDNPRNTRFAINFFTSIGLGGLTDDLREHLKAIPKPTQINDLNAIKNADKRNRVKSESESESSSNSSTVSSSSSPSPSSSPSYRRKSSRKSSKHRSHSRKDKKKVEKHQNQRIMKNSKRKHKRSK